MVWIWTAVVSLWLYPRESSYELLAAAVLDLTFGFATLLLRDRRVLWLAQLIVIVGSTAFITWRLPELWLPMLAAICTLYALEPRD